MKGSCLCGAIEYEIDQLDMPISHCHCRTCRKAHAAAFASNGGVMREHFRWVKGKEKLAAFESSPGKLRHFCSVCGSHLMAERLAQPHVVVRVATLDEDPGANLLCTSGVHMTFRGYRTTRTFCSIKNGNPVDNPMH